MPGVFPDLGRPRSISVISKLITAPGMNRHRKSARFVRQTLGWCEEGDKLLSPMFSMPIENIDGE